MAAARGSAVRGHRGRGPLREAEARRPLGAPAGGGLWGAGEGSHADPQPDPPRGSCGAWGKRDMMLYDIALYVDILLYYIIICSHIIYMYLYVAS